MKGDLVVGVINYQGDIEKYQGKYLIGRKVQTHGILAGQWHLPGGEIKEEETPQEALRREIGEETGLDVAISTHLCTHNSPILNRRVDYYECAVFSNHAQAGSDLDAVKWVKKRKVAEKCGDRAVALWPQEVRSYFNL